MAKFPGRINTAVFISGRGSNLKSLIRYSKTKKSLIKIALVVSDNSNAKGLEYANNSKINNMFIKYSNRSNFENRSLKLLTKNNQATRKLKANDDGLSLNYLQNASQLIASFEHNIRKS